MSTSIVKLGGIGESLVFSSLKKRHKNVMVSEDRFDSVKDGTADSETVEVKCQVPIKIYSAFCIGSSQIVKCLNVDRLFFVKIARGDRIEIYESLKPRMPMRLEYNGDTCYFFKLTDLELYDTILDGAMASHMRFLSPSKYL
jgi:hypothetical protein